MGLQEKWKTLISQKFHENRHFLKTSASTKTSISQKHWFSRKPPFLENIGFHDNAYFSKTSDSTKTTISFLENKFAFFEKIYDTVVQDNQFIIWTQNWNKITEAQALLVEYSSLSLTWHWSSLKYSRGVYGVLSKVVLPLLWYSRPLTDLE